MIVLDYNATTPVHPDVIEAMAPYFHEHWGNPSSKHGLGKKAFQAVEIARSQVAELIGAKPREIIFTSGGTEATNLALFGSVQGPWPILGFWGLRGILSTVIEHPATMESLIQNKRKGIGFRLARVLTNGQVDLEHLRRLMIWRPRLLSLIHAHNETGTVQPVSKAVSIAREFGALVHTDASQSIGKLPVNVDDLGVDLLTIAGHKLYAPKGIGALYVRNGTTIQRQLCGAGQENGFRGGTENVPYIVGLGKAARLVELSTKHSIARLRDELWQLLSQGLGPNIRKFTHETECLPNTLFVALRKLDSASLLANIPELAASTGSACHDGNRMGSAVLRAMGVPEEWLGGTIRLTLCSKTSSEEIQTASRWIIEKAKIMMKS